MTTENPDTTDGSKAKFTPPPVELDDAQRDAADAAWRHAGQLVGHPSQPLESRAHTSKTGSLELNGDQLLAHQREYAEKTGALDAFRQTRAGHEVSGHLQTLAAIQRAILERRRTLAGDAGVIDFPTDGTTWTHFGAYSEANGLDIDVNRLQSSDPASRTYIDQQAQRELVPVMREVEVGMTLAHYDLGSRVGVLRNDGGTERIEQGWQIAHIRGNGTLALVGPDGKSTRDVTLSELRYWNQPSTKAA